MSERRPQWDDDVIRAVTDAIDANFGDPSYQMVWDVIAAVEDWHSKRSGCEPPCTCWADAGEQRVRAEDAEAAIKRVREVCANPETTWRPGEGLGLVRVESILRALDGERDE